VTHDEYSADAASQLMSVQFECEEVVYDAVQTLAVNFALDTAL